MTAKTRPATYFHAPRPGVTCSTRSATSTAIIPATRNHELDTRTSAPARVPTLNVPGGRGDGSGACSGGGAGDDTQRAYATAPVRPATRPDPAASDCPRARLVCST